VLYSVVLPHPSRYSVCYTPQDSKTAAHIFRPAKYALFPLFTAKKKAYVYWSEISTFNIMRKHRVYYSCKKKHSKIK